MYGIYSKFIQVLYTLDTNCVPNIMILAQEVIQIFLFTMCLPKSEKGHNSVKYSQNFTKS